MTFQDLLKFATQEAVKRMEKPKAIRQEERSKRKAEKQPLSNWAFGVLPMAVSIARRRLKEGRRG
ncbi:YqzE family protein [Shouchella clausii]|uniref:YqzE family protein n=1 Tax=Shouchella clausii TaxID=79880 RepID=A0A268RZ03_SHOCL|nr:YqzE family protein [Shouchella clausii]PAD43007.1 hypothetical protein CHH54_09075 [Bacillus sp. 7520-S]SPU20760.1 Uncharacterised protein [Niallia circulans]AST97227.1 hypothetical protein BC8716_15200 [Shouchella clausii]MBU8594769.1 YqzE family protein [Shouchella clausii]MCM3547275.1 YqzE family protein [Shouchella clausii]